MAFWREINESFSEGGTLIKLIYINIGVFLAVRVLSIFIDSSLLLSFVAMPIPLIELIHRPWTVLTYMFVHYDFIHVFFNLLCLYWFGRIFTAIIGQRTLLLTYLVGGLMGCVACLAAQFFMPISGSVMIGASAAVMAILLAVAVYAPNYKIQVIFIGIVPLKYYAAFFVVIDIISVPGLVNTGGHLAHLGGALAGILLSLWWKWRGLPHARLSRHNRNRQKMHVVYNNQMTEDMKFNARRQEHNREIDRILDKMKQSGYDGLSKAEKQTLFDESKNNSQ